MEDRILASIEIIKDIQPIKNADRIEVATIKGWKVVVKKDQFKVNDKCVYFEIDSILPFESWSEFLRNKDKPDKPIRLKTIRLRKQISQGLALPLSDVLGDKLIAPLGTDLTGILGVIKYVPEIPAQLSGEVKGWFPGFLQKTDEERIQNLPEYLEKDNEQSMLGKEFQVTEKLDGTSVTFYNYNGEFGVCSRNLELKESESNTYWKVARKYQIEEKLRNTNFALQGEIVGPGIQGNKLKLKEHHLFIYNLYYILKERKAICDELVCMVTSMGLDLVPILDSFCLEGTMEDIIKMANGKSKIYSMAKREGIVFKSMDDPHISFKAISNDYLLDD